MRHLAWADVSADHVSTYPTLMSHLMGHLALPVKMEAGYRVTKDVACSASPRDPGGLSWRLSREEESSAPDAGLLSHPAGGDHRHPVVSSSHIERAVRWVTAAVPTAPRAHDEGHGARTRRCPPRNLPRACRRLQDVGT